MKKTREKIVIKTSIISIISNIVLALFKAFVGILANSIAIVTDAINNLSDALSSIITIAGTKLASRAPDKEHPYGHGRIEYMASLIISIIVLYAGLTAFIESIKKIIHPEDVKYTTISFIILISGILVKFILGLYVKRKGKEANSDSLVASGSDAFMDAILSISVLSSAIIYLLFNIQIEAYVGAIVSIIIIKSGLELIKGSVNLLVGVRASNKLTHAIKRDICKEKDVLGAFDLVLNDYGPDRYMGSVHIEVLDTMSVKDVDKLSRKITKDISKKHGVILHTIGIYSVNSDEKVKKIRREIHNIVFSHKEVLEMHGFYLDEEESEITFDIIIDFKAKNTNLILKKIKEEIKRKYKQYSLNITVDLDISD